MNLPSTVCLHLALLSLGAAAPAAALAASSSPTSGTEDHDLTVAEDILAAGVSYTFIRDGDPKKPFTLTEGTTDEEPVKIRSVKSAPAGLTVTYSGSTFTLKGTAGGTVVFETQFRDVAVSIGVNKAPVCDGEFKQIVGLGQRDVLVDAADLCIDPEGKTPTVESVKAADGSDLKVSYNDDGTATVHLPSSGEGSTEIEYRVADGDNNGGGGGFTIVSRDWDFFYRAATGGSTTIDGADLAEQVSTKEDPLKTVAVDIVDEDELLELPADCCGTGTFTITTRDEWDFMFSKPQVNGEFVDAESTPVYATWDVEYNEVATCTDSKLEVSTKETSTTLSLASYCKDPEGDALTVEGVTIDGKEAKYAYDAKTSALTVYFPYSQEAGGSFKVQARIGNNGGRKWDPTKEGTFTIVFRDDF